MCVEHGAHFLVTTFLPLLILVEVEVLLTAELLAPAAPNVVVEKNSPPASVSWELKKLPIIELPMPNPKGDMKGLANEFWEREGPPVWPEDLALRLQWLLLDTVI